MQEKIVTFQVAKLAKEKGFNIETRGFYNNGIYVNTGSEIGQYHSFHNGRPKINDDKICLAPTQSLLQKWLREVHDLHIVIQYSKYWKGYQYRYDDWRNREENPNTKRSNYPDCKTYEEALEKGLYSALLLL